MSIDHDDPMLEQALIRRRAELGRDLVLPDLHAMVLTATEPEQSRRRWVWPLLAAVLLLAVPLITVIALHKRPHATAPATPRPDQSLPASFVTIGPVAWSNAITDGAVVQVESSLTAAQSCDGPPAIRAEVTAHTATSVTVVVTAYRNTDPKARTKLYDQLCADPSTAGGTVLDTTVRLDAPLGHRSLVDGTTRQPQTAVDADGFPTITALPAGFSSDSSFERSAKTPDTLTRVWSDSTGELLLTRVLYDSADGQQSDWNLPAAAATTVLGHPAKFQTLGGPHVSWRDGNYLYSVGQLPSNGAGTYRYGEPDLLRFANSIH